MSELRVQPPAQRLAHQLPPRLRPVLGVQEPSQVIRTPDVTLEDYPRLPTGLSETALFHAYRNAGTPAQEDAD